MKCIKIIALLLVAGLAACSSDDETERGLLREDAQNLKKRPLFDEELKEMRLITVDVEETPMTDVSAAEDEKMETRATPTITSSLAAFSMNYQNSKYDFTKGGGGWSTNSWPNVENSEKIDFYAYTRGEFNYNSGNPYLSFTVEEDASSQYDLLVAEHKQIAYNDAGGHVSLTFDHACAAIQFKIGQSQALANKSVTFKSITLVDVYKSGKYYYNQTPAWQELSDYAYYTLENASSISIPVSTKTHDGARLFDCGYLFMIPQAHSNAKIRIGYNDNKTAEISLGDINWEAGKQYTISIRLGTNTIVTE